MICVTKFQVNLCLKRKIELHIIKNPQKLKSFEIRKINNLQGIFQIAGKHNYKSKGEHLERLDVCVNRQCV